MHLYKSWDDCYYITDKFDGHVGHIKNLKGLKGLITLIKHVGLKATWSTLVSKSKFV